jgi:hypothetical protein
MVPVPIPRYQDSNEGMCVCACVRARVCDTDCLLSGVQTVFRMKTVLVVPLPTRLAGGHTRATEKKIRIFSFSCLRISPHICLNETCSNFDYVM